MIKREFISLSGNCPFYCAHCYTFSKEYIGNIQEINNTVEDLKTKGIDIIYISWHRENFVNPEEWLELVRKIFKTLHCHILITTRNIFSKIQIKILSELYDEMKKEGKELFFCVSIPALQTYRKLEPNKLIPSPEQRINFLEKIYNLWIPTILTIRPLCPSSFIPIEEPLEIIQKCAKFSSVILSSGIGVNSDILKRLKTFPKNISSQKSPLKWWLQDNMIMDYIDVSKELELIQKECEKYNLRLFQESIPAVEYLLNEK